MKIDFTKNTRRNILSAFLNKGIGLLFPFLNRTLFLWLMVAEYLGLNGLFTSILGVLALADLGFGTAVVCSMYKPIADDDRELVCAYLRLYRGVYRWVGTAIFAIGLCLLPFLDSLVKGGLPPELDLHVLYLIHLVNAAAGYFLLAYRGSVLNAYHRGDVMTNIRTFTSLAQCLSALKAVALCVSANLVARLVPIGGAAGLVAKGAVSGVFVACAVAVLFRREVGGMVSRFRRSG